jgi:hypothetical protein
MADYPQGIGVILDTNPRMAMQAVLCIKAATLVNLV